MGTLFSLSSRSPKQVERLGDGRDAALGFDPQDGVREGGDGGEDIGHGANAGVAERERKIKAQMDWERPSLSSTRIWEQARLIRTRAHPRPRPHPHTLAPSRTRTQPAFAIMLWVDKVRGVSVDGAVREESASLPSPRLFFFFQLSRSSLRYPPSTVPPIPPGPPGPAQGLGGQLDEAGECEKDACARGRKERGGKHSPRTAHGALSPFSPTLLRSPPATCRTPCSTAPPARARPR